MRTPQLSAMAPPNPRADWERLDEQFYRKVKVYEALFDEDLELENYIVAGAPYGGALGKPASIDDLFVFCVSLADIYPSLLPQ